MCEVFMELFEELRMANIGQSIRVTVAYSDTFPVSGGCHCNRLTLYYLFSVWLHISCGMAHQPVELKKTFDQTLCQTYSPSL